MSEAPIITGNGVNPDSLVMLGREMRIRLDGPHMKSLSALAKTWGWSSPTDLAESLLTEAIEEKARNTVRKRFLTAVMRAFCG